MTEIIDLRAELEKKLTAELWDRILAKLMRTNMPPLDASRIELIDWLIETEALGMNVYRLGDDTSESA